VQRLDPWGAATSRTSTTFTWKSGCLPLSRRGPFKLRVQVRTSTWAVAPHGRTGTQFYCQLTAHRRLGHLGFEVALTATEHPVVKGANDEIDPCRWQRSMGS